MARLLLFDIDCTLITLKGAGMRNLGRATREVAGIDFEGSGIRPDGWTDPLILRELLRQRGVPTSRWKALEEEIWDLYAAYLEDELSSPDERHRVEVGVLELLESLRPIPDCHLGLLTGNLERTARIKLQPFALNDYFPIGAYGSDCSYRDKLGPVALERARRHFGRVFEPQEVWVIGDTDRDIQAARAFGARVLAVATGSFSLAQLEEHMPDQALPHLGDTQAVMSALLY